MNYKTHKAGTLRGEKITYKDGTGCCIWIPFEKENEEEEEQAGICFDFPVEALPDLKKLAQILIDAEADIYIPDPEEEKYRLDRKKKENTIWYKLKDWLENISLTITPFDWKFTTLFILVKRPISHGSSLSYRLCNGFVFGPITVTWT